MALDIDRHADVASSIQRWDPRAKLLSMLILIFAVALLQSIPLVIIGFAVSFTLLLISKIPLHFAYQLIKIVAIFLVPFFIILPLTYPGETEMHFLGMPFAIEGVRLAALIVIKALSIVIAAFVIFGSGRFDIAMIALQDLKCSPVIVQMMLFTYRYIFLFLSEMRRMDIAMKARGFIKRPNLYTLKALGGFIGTLLIRSFERTERIYKAMLSKGYQGELHTLVEFKTEAKDYIKSALIISVAIALLGTDLAGIFQSAEQSWY